MSFEMTREEVDVIIKVMPKIMRCTWIEVNTTFKEWLIGKYPFIRMGAIQELFGIYLGANRHEKTSEPGWIVVKTSPNITIAHPWDIVEWIRVNTKGSWSMYHLDYHFEDPDDAFQFKLVWA